MHNVIVLDVETTGKERSRDQIIELCIQHGLVVAHETGHWHTWRIKPTVPIHPEAQKTHGITAEALVDCPSFADVAPKIVSHLAAAEVIVGYNVAFDLDMVQAELERARLPLLDLAAKQVVDVLRLWHHVEPRTLVAAHEKFCGLPLADAHAASADVAATGRVLLAMLDRFGLADRAWPDLAAIANPFAGRVKWIGPTHHIQWDDGHAVFAFGKNAGVRIVNAGGSFLGWVIGKDFPQHVKEICREAFRRQPDDLDAWVAAKWPPPVESSTEAA